MLQLESGEFLGRPEKRIDLPGLRVSQSSYRPSSHLPSHTHEHGHFCLVVEGHYTERLAGRDRDRSPLDCMWYPPDAAHAERHRSAGTHLLVEVTPETLDQLEASAAVLNEPREIDGPRARGIAARLRREFEGADGARALAVESLGLDLLQELLPRPRIQESTAPAWLRIVDELLEARFAESISLSCIAEEVGVHRCHLARTYRRFRNRSIGEQVRWLRLEYACRKLAEPEASLADVATLAGFADQAHFSKVFKRQVSMTPGQYREVWRARTAT